MKQKIHTNKSSADVEAEPLATALASALANRFLTERELAERWAISVKLLQKWRLVGDGLPYQKFGSAVRYSMAAIHAFECATARQNTSQS